MQELCLNLSTASTNNIKLLPDAHAIYAHFKCLSNTGWPLPVILLVDAGVARRVIHAACHHFISNVDNHFAHLVAVALS